MNGRPDLRHFLNQRIRRPRLMMAKGNEKSSVGRAFFLVNDISHRLIDMIPDIWRYMMIYVDNDIHIYIYISCIYT